MSIPYPSKKTLFYLAVIAGAIVGLGKLPVPNPAVVVKPHPAHTLGELAAYAGAAGTTLQALDNKPGVGLDRRPVETAATAIIAASKVAQGLENPVPGSAEGEGDPKLSGARFNRDGAEVQ